jgi:hypothetical protein
MRSANERLSLRLLGSREFYRKRHCPGFRCLLQLILPVLITAHVRLAVQNRAIAREQPIDDVAALILVELLGTDVIPAEILAENT